MPRQVGILALVLFCLCATPAAAAPDPLRAHQWGLDMVQAGPAHATSTGSGAVVAVVDTGVKADHPDLVGQTLPGHDFVQNDDTPQDGNGHGTHVTGVIDALTGNGIGVESVAPGAKVLPVRVLDDSGSGDADTVAAGVDWATQHGADVINLSLGGAVPLISGSSDSFDAALDRALDRGVIVVAAAGNDGLPVCEQPSGQGRLLCVGAVDRRGNRSYFSNFGMGLGLVAPGGSGLPGDDEDILSTWNDGGYQEVAGTSQATPFVSGVAALLVSKGIRGQAAVQRILATARDAGPLGPDGEYGAGIVDAARAVAGLGGGSGGSGGQGGSSSGAPAGGGAPPVTQSASVRISVPGRISRRALAQRGLAVRCKASGAGVCAVVVKLGRRVVARGSARVTAGRSTVRARLTGTGRQILARRAHPVRLAVTVTCPGTGPQTTRLTAV
jgi:subtilisin family serine protease